MKLNIKRKISFFLICLSLYIFVCIDSFAQSKNPKCDAWHNRIAPQTHLNLSGVSNMTQEEIFDGIACLMKLKGKKNSSNVMGASRGDVSNFFGATSVEVAALYYISFLFYQKWDHADAPFLVDKSRKLNSIKAVSKAYKSYEKWFKRVKTLGLDKARKQKLDPLDGSGVSWY
ncbi:MAG: hypothetical protein AB1757_06070 [Acidobacteriota bacterium]